MFDRRFGLACAGALAAGAWCGPAQAQLVVGTTGKVNGNIGAYYINVDALTATPLWATGSASKTKVNGIAADPVNRLLYENDAARVNVWQYGRIGTAPTFIAGAYRSNGTTTSATGLDDLTFINGELYCWTDYPSTTFTRGIYKVPVVPDANNRLILSPVWLDTTSTYSFKGLAYNPADGLFYGTNIADTTGSGGNVSPGLYSIDGFGSGTVARVADFPAGRTEIDGIAIGGGFFWLTEKDRNSQNIYIYPYDPAAQAYDVTLQLAYPDSAALSSGATWAPGAPEPATLGLLGLAFVGAVRRRR